MNSPEEEDLKRRKPRLREWFESIIWAFVIAMVIRTFFIQALKYLLDPWKIHSLSVIFFSLIR